MPSTTELPPLAPAQVEVDALFEEARRRQRRRRRGIALALLAAALATVLALQASSPPPKPPRSGAGNAASGATRHVSLGLPAGQSTSAFRIVAPANHAYEVSIVVPARSAIVLTVKIGPGSGWSVDTRRNQDCRATTTTTACLVPFAAGGNPGGTWTATIRKLSIPPAQVQVAIRFARRAGDYSS
jgi:hypothetical protein